MKTHILSIGTCLVFAAGSLMAAAPETNATPAAATTAATPADAPAEGAKPSWTSFTLITRNNIFDPQRAPYTGVPRQVQAPIQRVQEFDLTGTWLKVGKGYDAEFEGYGVRNAVQSVGDTVADFKIVNITVNGVDLINTRSTSNDVINVPVLHGLRRLNGGEWMAAVTTPTYQQPRPMAPRIPPASIYAYTPPPTYDTPDYTVNTYDNTQNDYTGNTRGRGRGRGGNNGGGRQRGGNNNGGGGFGGNGFGAQDDTIAAPAAPADPNILKILQARREAEENAK